MEINVIKRKNRARFNWDLSGWGSNPDIEEDMSPNEIAATVRYELGFEEHKALKGKTDIGLKDVHVMLLNETHSKVNWLCELFDYPVSPFMCSFNCLFKRVARIQSMLTTLIGMLCISNIVVIVAIAVYFFGGK